MKILSIIISMQICLGMIACTEEKDFSTTLNILSEGTEFPAEGGVIEAEVISNETWGIECDQEWLEVSPTWGKLNAKVTFTAKRNESKSYRTAIASLNGLGTKVQFTQKGQSIGSSTGGNVASNGKYDWVHRLEVPELKSGNILHPVVTYEQAVQDSVMTFIYEWDPEKLHIRWTAFYFDSFTCQKNWKRKDWESTEWGGDPWHDDMYLAESMRTTYDNHRGNGYDRGHMVASGDRLYSSQANLETYMYSNMSPQLAAFNQDYWSQLEQKIQGLGGSRKFCDTLYVCKGATIDNKADILATVKSIVVPKYYYMAVMRVKDGKYDAAGFLMEHTSEGYTKNMSLKPYAMSIDELETATGVNFFHNLPDDTESEVEKNYDESIWFF